jgi:general secretion pathway protein J
LQAALAFQGKPHSLQFVSAFPASAARTGLQLFSVAMDNENNEQVIKITMTPFFPVRAGVANKEEVVLLKHVRNFSLAYFGSDDGDNASWHDEWIEKNAQPRLIKIAIQLDNDLFVPEMMIPLKITGQAMNNNAVLIQ